MLTWLKIAAMIAAMVALPTFVFIGGVRLMEKLTDRPYITRRLKDEAKPEDRTPLYKRWWGYDAAAAARHWGALDKTARDSERYGLELDLLFPFFYLGALAISLLWAWTTLNGPFHPLWLIAPTAAAAIADWTENLVLWTQLRRFTSDAVPPLQSNWIQVASTATILKTSFSLAAVAVLLVLIGMLIVRALRSA